MQVLQLMVPLALLVLVLVGLQVISSYSPSNLEIVYTPSVYPSPLYVPFNVGVKQSAAACPLPPPVYGNCTQEASYYQDLTLTTDQRQAMCNVNTGCCYSALFQDCLPCLACTSEFPEPTTTLGSERFFSDAHSPGASAYLSSVGVVPVPVDFTNASMDLAQYLMSSIGRTPTQAELAGPRSPDYSYYRVSERRYSRIDYLLKSTSPWGNRVEYSTPSRVAAFYAPLESDLWRSAWQDDQRSMVGVLLFVNSSYANRISPTFVNMFNTLQLRNLTGSSTAKITMRSQPLGLRYRYASDDWLAWPTLILLLVVFALVPSAFVVFAIREAASGAKHLQLLAGVRPSLYWLASYVWDVFFFLVASALIIVVLVLFDFAPLTSELGPTITCVVMFGLAVVPFGYLVSLPFKSHGAGQGFMVGSNLVFGILLLVLMYSFDYSGLSSVSAVLRWLLRVSPSFCFSDALFSIVFIKDVSELLNQPRTTPIVFDAWDLVSLDLLVMALQAVGYLALLMVIESMRARAGCRRRCGGCAGCCRCKRLAPRVAVDCEADEEDVATERSRLMTLSKPQAGSAWDLSASSPSGPSGSSASRSVSSESRLSEEEVRLCRGGGWVQCHGLRKEYSSKASAKAPSVKVAVEDFWLGVAQGECFGFLGNNGAGKSSVLAALSGQSLATAGKALVKGIDVEATANGQSQRVSRLIGYCPQQVWWLATHAP